MADVIEYTIYGDDLQMVRRPSQMEGQRKVRFTEELEILRRPFLALGIDDLRYLTNVPSRLGNGRVPCPGPFLHRLIRIPVWFRTRFMPYLHQPRHVAEQIHKPTVADPESGSRAMAMDLPFVDHLAQRRRVQQPA